MREDRIRHFLQRLVCFFFEHSPIGIVTTEDDIKTIRDECILCGKFLSKEKPYTEPNQFGFATEILIHHSLEDEECMGVSLVGNGRIFTFWLQSMREDCDDVDAAVNMATSLEECTGLTWSIWDEANGPFSPVYDT